jgi:hypothetical protein
MSKMKSMKMEKADADKLYGQPTAVADSPQYPYGLRLNLDNAAVEKLGIGLPKVGEKLMIEAYVDVVSVSASDSKEGMRKNIELQITDLCLEPRKEEAAEQEAPASSVSPDAFYAASPEFTG